MQSLVATMARSAARVDGHIAAVMILVETPVWREQMPLKPARWAEKVSSLNLSEKFFLDRPLRF